MKTTLTMELTRVELKAAAKYQDVLHTSVNDIMTAIGKEAISLEMSNWDQVKILLGSSKTIEGGMDLDGVKYNYKTVISKTGVVVDMSYEVSEEVSKEVFSAYGDIANIYAPAISSSILAISNANKLAEERATKAGKKISKLIK